MLTIFGVSVATIVSSAKGATSFIQQVTYVNPFGSAASEELKTATRHFEKAYQNGDAEELRAGIQHLETARSLIWGGNDFYKSPAFLKIYDSSKVKTYNDLCFTLAELYSRLGGDYSDVEYWMGKVHIGCNDLNTFPRQFKEILKFSDYDMLKFLWKVESGYDGDIDYL